MRCRVAPPSRDDEPRVRVWGAPEPAAKVRYHPAMRLHRLRQPTIKAALALGFALVVGLWGYTGYELTARMAAVEAESADITTRYLRAQERLAGIRGRVLTASVQVRDALLDPDGRRSQRYDRRLDETYASIDRALREYVPVLDTEAERAQVTRLRQEINDFRLMTRQVLERTTNLDDVRTVLNQNLVPRREAAIRVSEEVQSLNRAAFLQHRADIATVYRVAERQAWRQLGLALVGSLCIALAFSVYAGRLESRLHLQMTRNDENTRELQVLSTRLLSAQEEERRRIARELHDEVGQALTAVQVELTLAQRRLSAAGQPLALLGDASSITHGALQTVRDISQLLHPALLDDLGLVTAIEWQARVFEGRYGITVTFESAEILTRLPSEVERAAYRIVQEALTNIARHARASRCRIVLRQQENYVEVLVEDDGCGFDLADGAHATRGLGLSGMRERAALVDGRVALESQRGVGTRVNVRLPVNGHTLG